MSRVFVVSIAVAALLAGCGGEPGTGSGDGGPEKPAKKLLVMTTFYPTQYFTEVIGGDLVEVVCPVPEGEDAIFWQPDEETISRYQKADLIVLNGADFAKWVAKTPLPSARVLDTAKPFADTFIRYEKATTHAHGPAGAHAHEGIDGHTWLDPLNAKVQAGEIHQRLLKMLPEHEERLNAGFRTLNDRLTKLERAFGDLKKGLDERPILASHPAYNYIAERYGWKLINLDLDPEEMPSDETFAAIAAILKKSPAEFLIWEGDPKPEIAKRFADELNIRSVTFSPCELYEGEDYTTVMERNVERLKPVFEFGGD
jgi:zinc transport system substrate-binding protein